MAVVMKKSRGSKAAASASPADSGNRPEDGMWDRIARKAYELWDARGRREGYDLQDWLDAEQMVTAHTHEARK